MEPAIRARGGIDRYFQSGYKRREWSYSVIRDGRASTTADIRSMPASIYGLVPDEPVAFLRYVVYRLTDSSLLIKNNELIKKIKEVKQKQRRMLDKLIAEAPKNLASIFYRFKPIFWL